MIYKQVVVCGCVKNAENYLKRSIPKLKKLEDIFNRVVFIFFENDSSDNTLQILQDYGMIVISYKNLPIQNRMDVLAFGRNKLLEYIETYHNDLDLMIMMDFDYVLERFDHRMFEEIFEEYGFNKWDVLTANSYNKYYDIYALRTEANEVFKDEILFNCWDMINKGRRCNIPDTILLREFVGKYQICIPDDKPLIPVLSAFGGIGIYKIEFIKGARYSTLYGCEHVSFNEELRKNGARIFICPKLLVCAEPKHIVK